MALLARFDFSYTLLRESMFLDALLRYAPWFTMLTVLIFIPFKLYSSLWGLPAWTSCCTSCWRLWPSRCCNSRRSC